MTEQLIPVIWTRTLDNSVIIQGVNPAGLYLHVPFCSSVCPYCDFAVTIAGDDRREKYLDALEREIALAAGLGLRFDTVYFGGGTPSSLTPEQLGRVLATIDAGLDLAPDATRHLEINPDDVSPAAAAAWRELDFSFASLGVQSFSDDVLGFLGRRHRAAEARRAAETLLDAGFATVSVDLIFGLPGQTNDDWRRQLGTVLSLGVHHLSCYQLTIHEGTVFGRQHDRGELRELNQDDQAELYLQTHELLGAAGWEGYEVSNFAAGADHRSKHNRKYWDHTPYLGLGPSAHSFVGRRRWWNQRKVRLWAAAINDNRSPIEGQEDLSDAELFFEAVMLGLRTAEGIDCDALHQRFGTETVRFDEPAIERLTDSGHLRCDGPRIRPTSKGMAIAEGLVRTVLR
jgi:putative oxygen-independent coproporphyrinogen III oxidase